MKLMIIGAAILLAGTGAGVVCMKGSGDCHRGGPERNHHNAVDDAPITGPDGSVAFRGGYDTDPQDGGRPVRLIAAALGVETQVFRDAFRGVTPSRFGPPTASHARANKEVLMDALGKHGVTNERLDEVSNYYRYRPGHGELWTVTPASAEATIENSRVTGLKITNPGAGYMESPRVVIVGHEDVKVRATLEFTQNLNTNGRIKSLEIIE